MTNPEKKRKIIGKQFIDSFDRISNKQDNIEFSPGYLYPDVIESGVSNINTAHVIKSHHNVCGSPKEMKFQLIELLENYLKMKYGM